MATQTPNGFAAQQVSYPILSGLGLLSESNYEAYTKKYPDVIRDSYIMTAESLPGVLKWSPNKKYKLWQQNDKPMQSFKVTGAGEGSGAGAAVTVTLTAASHLSSGSLSPVSIGQTWVDDKDNIAYQVTAVGKGTAGAHTVTLSPWDISKTAAITTDSFLKYHGRDSVKEASGQEEGVYKGYTSVTKDMTAIRVNKAYTDLSAFERLEIEGETYMTLDRSEMEDEYLRIQELRLMFGQLYNNNKNPNSANSDFLGLIPQVQNYGTTIAPGAAINDAYFQSFVRQNDADGYTDEYHSLVDTEFAMKMEDYLADKYVEGINYASFGGDSAVAISRNFKSYNVYGVSIHRKKYAYFNSSRVHGAEPNTGFWRNTSLFIPQTSQVFEGERFRNFTVHYLSTGPGGKINTLMKDGALLVEGSLTMNAELAMEAWKGVSLYNPLAYKLSRLTS